MDYRRPTSYFNGAAASHAAGPSNRFSRERHTPQRVNVTNPRTLQNQIEAMRNGIRTNQTESETTHPTENHSPNTLFAAPPVRISSPQNTSISSPEIDKLEEQISSLTDKRNGLTGAPKGNAAKQIFGLQKKLISEIAKKKGWSQASPAALKAKDKFLKAFQAVVDECDYCNSNPSEFKSREANEVATVLEGLQDSMSKDFLSLVGTDAGADLKEQVTSMASGLTTANKNYINTYTGVQGILWGNYSKELGPKPKAA